MFFLKQMEEVNEDSKGEHTDRDVSLERQEWNSKVVQKKRKKVMGQKD